MTRGGRVGPVRVGGPRAPSPAVPHAGCTRCAPGAPCAFHRAGTGPRAVAVLRAALANRGVVGLADFFEAAFAALAEIPAELLVDCDPVGAEAELAEILERDGFDGASLRRLAALALALAVHDDAQGDDDDDAEDAEVSDDGT